MKTHTTQTTLMCVLLATTWALTHHYALSGDGELYAFQALARITPALSHDVYLASTSQDRYTLFSPLFAWVIRWFGLLNAAAGLFALCTACFFAAAWALARELWNGRIAWLSMVMLVVSAAGYGAYGVFHCTENYLTARSIAEALVVASLALRFRGFSGLSWAVAILAALMHPLMALPGLLLLMCLAVSWPVSLLGAIAGTGMALAIEGIATFTAPGNVLSIMHAQWLEVVRERSQFLFLRYWHLSDWEMHARVLMCLMLATFSSSDLRLRRLCIAAALVGVTGLLIALIAGSLGPVAILLQGQAWRWFWVTAFVSLLTVLPTAVRLWGDGGCGSVSATLLVCGWTFNPVNGTYLVAAALCLWALRGYVQPSTQRVLRMLALLLIVGILTWTCANIWSVCSTPLGTKSDEPAFFERLRSIFALPTAALAIYGLGWRWMRTIDSAALTAIAGLLLLTVGAFAMNGSFARPAAVGSRAEIDAFVDWRNAIPATSNVLLVPTRNSAGFIWFSLMRPSYMSVNQSAGVVFSSVTAREIKRRSDVLLPIMEPDWRLLSQNTLVDQGKRLEGQTRPLTAERLIAICSDPQLGFVVAKELLGFGALTHRQPGEWKNWNLYDCRKVRQLEATA